MVNPHQVAAPPHDVDAEQAVLGSAMQHDAAYEYLRGAIEASDFYRPAHGTIWEALDTMREVGKPIDPLGLMMELRVAGTLERCGGATYLHTLLERGYSPSAYSAAHRVRELRRARAAQMTWARMGQLFEEVGDVDDLMGGLARESLAMETLIDERSLQEPLDGLMSWPQLWNHYPTDSVKWLVEGLLVAEDVWMLLGTEGGGKSWFSRQFCLALAAGIHPLHPGKRIEPVRTLLVDLENPPAIIAYESRLLGNQVARHGEFDPDLAQVYLREDGLNLRERRDQLLLERAIAQTQPQLVAIGSLYKAYKRGRDDWDHAAEDVREVLDRIRRRYGCTLLLEHHMPKGAGPSDRPMSPFGSSTWQKWPSLGHTIHRVGDNAWQLSEFRGTRLAHQREVPVGLSRGGPLPWSPIWTTAELTPLMWERLRPRKPASA